MEALAEEIPTGFGTVYGWVRRFGRKGFLKDSTGRIIITLTDTALSSLESAVKTVGHQLHHVGEALAGAKSHTDTSELLAEVAGELFFKRFREGLKRLN